MGFGRDPDRHAGRSWRGRKPCAGTARTAAAQHAGIPEDGRARGAEPGDSGASFGTAGQRCLHRLGAEGFQVFLPVAHRRAHSAVQGDGGTACRTAGQRGEDGRGIQQVPGGHGTSDQRVFP